MFVTPDVVRTFGRVVHDQRAVALTEFAIVTPVLLLLGLGGLELANYVGANLRLSQIAMTVADNAGRIRTSIDEADINELMIGAKKIGEPIDFAENGRVILSDLEQRTNVAGGAGTSTPTNPNGYRQWIRWQRCAGALKVSSSYGLPLDLNGAAVTDIGSTANDDHGAVETKSFLSGMGPSTNQISASSGTAVMVAEVFYVYQPIVPINYLGNLTIRRLQAFNVRQRTSYSLRNDGARSGTSRSDCRLNSSSVPA
ncbi:TadE/TadG family type IV pilus assembly protein [Sphingomonas faeni]|uniref:TadE/TadG family type IV pilus assembly protein n=1 Tax=Sphingomonas faeni TaxID=185950 RepID=UPI00335B50D0